MCGTSRCVRLTKGEQHATGTQPGRPAPASRRAPRHARRPRPSTPASHLRCLPCLPATPAPCLPSPLPCLLSSTPSPPRSETCKLTILEGLPCLKEVVACGYGEYVTEGLPASVQRLDLQVGLRLPACRHAQPAAVHAAARLGAAPAPACPPACAQEASSSFTAARPPCTPHVALPSGNRPTHSPTHPPAPPRPLHARCVQWAVNAASSSLVYFHVPEGCTLAELALCSQRPVCLPAPCLARCASLRVTARRAYLGLPLLAGAPWVDVDELAARFAQVRGAP